MKKPTDFRSRMPSDLIEYFREEGRRGGKLSGKARMQKLTPEQRKVIARKAAAARWAKRTGK